VAGGKDEAIAIEPGRILGLCLRNCVHSVKAMAAAPIGMPGCPAFAFCTASAEECVWY